MLQWSSTRAYKYKYTCQMSSHSWWCDHKEGFLFMYANDWMCVCLCVCVCTALCLLGIMQTESSQPERAGLYILGLDRKLHTTVRSGKYKYLLQNTTWIVWLARQFLPFCFMSTVKTVQTTQNNFLCQVNNLALTGFHSLNFLISYSNMARLISGLRWAFCWVRRADMLVSSPPV